jgi:hypothetical protein
MHEQFTHHTHNEIRFRHTPELTGFQWWLAAAASRLDFYHS